MKKLFYLAIYVIFSLNIFSMWDNNTREKILNMIKNGEDLNKEINYIFEKTIPLLVATDLDRFDLELLELLLINGANPNLNYNDKGSPLNNAAYIAHLDGIKILLKYGADTNLISDNSTPLIRTIFSRHKNSYEICKYLLENKANPNIITKGYIERTALTIAIRNVDEDQNYFESNKNIKIIKLLLSYGADPLLKIDKPRVLVEKYNYETAMKFAQNCKLDEVIKIFNCRLKKIISILLNKYTNPTLNEDVISIITKFIFDEKW